MHARCLERRREELEVHEQTLAFNSRDCPETGPMHYITEGSPDYVRFTAAQRPWSLFTMSASITPNDASPSTIQPLHNPSQAAQVVIPQAPLGNVVNQAPGMGAKALFAKKFTKAQCAYL